MKSQPYVPGWLAAAQMIKFVRPFTSDNKLERVLFRKQSSVTNTYECYSEDFSNLKEALTDLRQAQNLARNSSCLCGKLLSCYEGTDNDYVLRRDSCWGCSKTQCDGLCMDLQECYVCDVAMCGNCEGTAEGCKSVYSCDACENSFCEECRTVDFCDACVKPFCEECKTVIFCDACGKPFCEECRTVIFCDACGKTFCEECKTCQFHYPFH